MKQKSIITVLIAALSLLSCKEMQQEPVPGKAIGEIYVTAAPGSRSVLVKLDGLWRVRSMESWLSTDVAGREGEGAFTFSFDSNESDFRDNRDVQRGAGQHEEHHVDRRRHAIQRFENLVCEPGGIGKYAAHHHAGEQG